MGTKTLVDVSTKHLITATPYTTSKDGRIVAVFDRSVNFDILVDDVSIRPATAYGSTHELNTVELDIPSGSTLKTSGTGYGVAPYFVEFLEG